MISESGTKPLTEKTMMKTTSWSSMTRNDPITPIGLFGCWLFLRKSFSGRFEDGVEVVSGPLPGATVRDTPDIVLVMCYVLCFLVRRQINSTDLFDPIFSRSCKERMQ